MDNTAGRLAGSGPMTTYLVGLDASDHARDALSWALAVARQDDPVVAVYAWDVPVVTGYETGLAVDATEVEGSSEALVRDLIGDQPPGRVDGRIAQGPAGHALVEAAEELGPDVVVVVGHAGSGKTSVLLGSTAHHVVRHTDRPVVVVRGALRIPVADVVVGIDWDESDDDDPDAHSMAALRWALALPGVARVAVAHADFVPGVAAGPVVEPGLESEQEMEDDDSRLRSAIDAATDGTGVAPNGAEITAVLAAGTGGFAMIEASREADLVVIGTRGRSGIIELITGSTTLEVLAHAHCPVAVVR